MRARWVRFPTQVMPPSVVDESSYTIMGQCVTPPDGNEIILVRSNIHGTWSLCYVLLHELVHWLQWRLRAPRIFDYLIDELNWSSKRSVR
jgi:hypothetical protein